jgi:hypothetical protein
MLLKAPYCMHVKANSISPFPASYAWIRRKGKKLRPGRPCKFSDGGSTRIPKKMVGEISSVAAPSTPVAATRWRQAGFHFFYDSGMHILLKSMLNFKCLHDFLFYKPAQGLVYTR